jgi:hypothetical protein
MTLAWVALFNNVFSSLAGAYFQIVSVNQTISVPVTMSGNVGPNYNNLPVGYYLPYSSAAGVSHILCSTVVHHLTQPFRVSIRHVGSFQLLL